MNAINHFEKFRGEYIDFVRTLASDLNHPEDENKVGRVLRAVLHTLRDRLTVQQSFHVLAQLPMFLKLDFIEGWKYHEKPIKYSSIEEFTEAVKEEQSLLGERNFDWEESTEEIVNTVFNSLKKYLDEGTFQKIYIEFPASLHPLLE
jgi:uncharacterized protein (DUF2267 family)